MARDFHHPAAIESGAMMQPVIDSSAQLFESMLRAQRLQLEIQTEIVRSTQGAAAAVANELWDEWAAHWGGGVPLDG